VDYGRARLPHANRKEALSVTLCLPSHAPAPYSAAFVWRGLSAARSSAVLLLLLLGLPFGLSFLFPIYMVGRYDLLALRLFFLVCARGLVDFRPALIAIGLLAVVSLYFFYAPHRPHSKACAGRRPSSSHTAARATCYCALASPAIRSNTTRD